MRNRKGFTLVELLAVIVILGILGTIVGVSTMKYLTQSRVKSYKMMSQSVYEATVNCIVQGKCSAPVGEEVVTVETKDLFDKNYIEKLENPISSRSNDCYGQVIVKDDGKSNAEYKNYNYYVSLKCDGVANATIAWPEAKKYNEKEFIKNLGKTVDSKTDPLDVTIGSLILTKDNRDGNENGVVNSNSGTIDSSSSSNFAAAYSYSESSKNYCVTGRESTCVETNCYINNNSSCPAGTIIKYKVNSSDLVYFHVISDNGPELTMQSQQNVLYNKYWNNTGVASNGPIDILLSLNNAVSGWSNINNHTYIMGASDTYTSGASSNVYSSGVISGTNTGCSYYNTCTASTYTLGMRVEKARLITVQEAAKLGCTESYGSCPKWLQNYLYNSIVHGGTVNDDYSNSSNSSGASGVYNNGYWTMNTMDTSYVRDKDNVWIVDSSALLRNSSIEYSEGIGARAVVVVDKEV